MDVESPRASLKLSAAARRASALQAEKSNQSVELFVLGEISHGEGFETLPGGRGLVCQVSILTEGSQSVENLQWLPLSKQAASITSTSLDCKFETSQESHPEKKTTVWNHPVDIHYATMTISDWPRFRLRVLGFDARGRTLPIAYGTVVIPSDPGQFNIKVDTWRLAGTFWQELTGNLPYIGLPDIGALDTRAHVLRPQLTTVPYGSVHLQGEIILREFNSFGVNSG